MLSDALGKLLPEDSPNKAELLLLLAKLPSEGKAETGSCRGFGLLTG